ncbi:acyltransferase family protein [Methylobacterium sp. JK268]
MSGEARANNIGLLRLVLAALVVVSHAPELVDGDRSREILTRLFGTLSFGEVAVDGFFLLSGYLITRSVLGSASLPEFLGKRVLRIYPAYLVSSLVCIAVVAPLAGGDLGSVRIPDMLGRLLVLGVPSVPHVFGGLPYPVLNGSAWTIAYEFGCYLLAAGLGLCGALGPNRRFLAMLAVLAAACALRWHPAFDPADPRLFKLGTAFRFALIFCCGGAFFLYRDRIAYRAGRAAAAALLLAALLFHPLLAEPALTVLGGYLLFGFAFAVPAGRLARLAQETDISYGLYLYAWPIQNLVVMQDRTAPPWVVALVGLAGASLLGLLSWHLVERPALARRAALLRLTRPPAAR